MSVQIPIGAAADHRSWKRVADDATRTFGNAGKDAGRDFANALAGSSKDVEKSLKRMGDRASDAYDKAASAVGKLKSEESELQRLRDRDADGARIIRQTEKVNDARRAEARAVRDATRAYREYQEAADEASRRNNTNLVDGMRAQAGQAAQLGRDMGNGFSGGFTHGVSSAASIARLGTAGGPIGAALLGLTAVGILVGSRLSNAIAEGMATTATTKLFQGRMGLDDTSMSNYAKAAGQSYANNFGASVADNLSVAQAALRNNLIKPNSPDDEIQYTIQQLQGVAQVVEKTPQELAHSATQLMRTGLANSVTEALDIITAGSQKGLDVTGDWLDSIGEYSTQFRKLGLTGSETMTLLKQGIEGGARDTDKVADSLKEFSIRAVDGSKSTKEGFEALGFNADEMGRRFSAGGEQAHQAFAAVLTGLRNLDDPVQQALVWQRLFGTQWEDMGDAVNKLDLDPAKNQFKDLQDTSQRSTKTATETFKSEWESATKTVDQWFTDLKTSISDWFVDLPVIRDIPTMIKDLFSSSPPPPQYAAPLGGTHPGTDILANTLPGAPGAGSTVLPPAPGDNSARTLLGSALAPGTALPPPDAQRGNAVDNGPQAGDRKPIAPAGDDDKTKPPIDPSLWSVESKPVAMPPGLASAPTAAPGVLVSSPKGGPGLGRYEVDPMRVYDAESSAIRAKNSLEQDRIALIRLEQQGNADQDALLRARNQVADAERSYVSAQMKLAEAQQGTWKKLEGATQGLADGMGQIGAALDKDFGISKGLPGLAENLTKFLANMAAAPILGQLGAVSQLNPSKGGYGAMGILAAQGVFGPQYTGLPESAAYTGAGYPGSVASAQGGYAPYPGDAALLAHVPAGRYTQEGRGDLTKGLADCSSAVEDLVNLMDGRPTAGASMWTGNAAEWLTQRGFVPGMGGPGDFRVGFNPQHMQATLPGGTNINWGSNEMAARRGIGGTGADDPAFTSHYYRPTTGGYSPVAPSVGVAPTPIPPPSPGYAPLADSALTNPGLTNPALTPGVPAAGGWGGATGPAQAWSPSSTRIGGVEPATGSGAGGVGITAGGTIDTAIGMAASAADIFAPGAGQAAQTGIKLANRAIQFGAQAAGIGVQGLMDTVLPTAGSELANKSWLTKILGGVAGAAPAIPNVAGKATAPPNPNQGDPNAQGGPVKAGDTNIHVTNNRATEDGTGRDIAFHQQARNSGPGM
ncbi:Gp22 [Mycobacteroides abscessus subsp. abscessus]|uniref:phage tail tape measure protein n=1 Tax=Mycobacteroides abscessus TaxID=36809 RepID=UPI000925F734|nr:phage tail tape measure protein [Mycobacteroides abscessus]SHY14383.1 Gp22 [Mycobacteroides abscessus subsp. abscessus]SID61074.1 Gp22 [Mycobacteroides abscessus subsp. abscessus]SIJ07576.1 Gp22 [Mycobacteroides abscessus subsp. abscessus]SKK60373.1 Gp22 [Mycobacteroides abscessus subsp. abscessus]SKP43006.1 Gp22 [Mycobacteroides abscessus subsp. abscessus]